MNSPKETANKITISISPFPPFFNLNFHVSFEKMAASFWGMYIKNKPFLTAELVQYVLKQILEDQFRDKDTAGAWGKRYVNYLRFTFDDEIPNDVSKKDSITYTAEAACPLVAFKKLLTEQNQELNRCLEDAKGYLLSRQDKRSGGFGLLIKTSRGDKRVAVDTRHTAYAIIALASLSGNYEAVSKGIKYLHEELPRINLYDERAFTLSVLHHFLSSNILRNKVSEIFSGTEKQTWSARIETELVIKFDKILFSWDMDKDPPAKARIDDALSVLLKLEESNIHSEDLRSICKTAVVNMLKKDLIALNKEEAGIPFIDNGRPDIGTTLQFLELVLVNKNLYNVEQQTINRMVNFVLRKFNDDQYTQFSYPWQLASALALSSLK
jgi:hypothetical protein